MAEAIAVIELAVGITEVVKKLYSFVSEVRRAKDEIRCLAQELFSLKGALEHFQMLSSKGGVDIDTPQEIRGMLQMTGETLHSMQKKLDMSKTSLVGRATRSLSWPFQREDVSKYLASLERAKTFFIMVTMRDSADNIAAIVTEMQRLAITIRADIVERKESQTMKEAQEFLSWLSPVNCHEILQEFLNDRLEGSGQWLWNKGFTLWEGGSMESTPVIWVSGKSGSGKTVLFSGLVQQLHSRIESQAHLQHALGFHFCSLDDAATQRISNVFGSFLAQITVSRPELLNSIRRIRPDEKQLIRQNNLSVTEIRRTMREALPKYSLVYLMVDALNETQDGDIIFSTLLDLCEEHANLRVLVTSTRLAPRSLPDISTISMDSVAIDSDIENYVRTRLLHEPVFRASSLQLQDEIKNEITSNANGVFRWAKLSMDRLSTFRTGREIRKALKDIPSTLNDVYVKLLTRIPETDQFLAREVLLWLCFCLRPLRLREIAEAVVFEEGDKDIDSDNRLVNPAVILEICQDFIHISWGGDYLTLAHDSIRTFLTSEWIKKSQASSFALDAADCHRRIMRKCLAYLSIREFADGPTPVFLGSRFKRYPLIDYASKLWPIHLGNLELRNDDERAILEFFATKNTPGADGGAFASWVQALLESCDLSVIQRTEPLYYAASFNMTHVLKLLLKPVLGIDLNRPGGRYGSPPLFVALWRANFEAVKMLLEAGADPDAVDEGSGKSSRHWAASCGHDDILEMMN